MDLTLSFFYVKDFVILCIRDDSLNWPILRKLCDRGHLSILHKTSSLYQRSKRWFLEHEKEEKHLDSPSKFPRLALRDSLPCSAHTWLFERLSGGLLAIKTPERWVVTNAMDFLANGWLPSKTIAQRQ